MVMISTGNDAVHNVVGVEDVKNIENSKQDKTWGVGTIYHKWQQLSIPNTEIITAAMTHRHENSAHHLRCSHMR